MRIMFLTLGSILGMAGAWIMGGHYAFGLVVTFIGLSCVLTALSEKNK